MTSHRLTFSAVFSLVVATALAACTGHPSSPMAPVPVTAVGSALRSPNTDFEAVRQATARFHDIDAALAAGYVDDGYGCIDAATFGLDPALGGMGFHLINETLHADPASHPLQPDLLVYAPAKGQGKPRLVALEYEVFVDDWYAANGPNAAPPELFGHEFERIDLDDLHIFGLHLWLWDDNPNGLFEDFNPRVSCQ